MEPSGALSSAVSALVGTHADRLVEAGEIRSPGVERAFRRVRRHLFLESFFRHGPDAEAVVFDPLDPDPVSLEEIYSGRVLVTSFEDGLATSSVSESALVARMIELLELRPGMRVLEIGTSSGYNGALLAEVLGDAQSVASVECQALVVERAKRGLQRAGYGGVDVVLADGFFGYAGRAPYDRIVVTVGCTDLSPHWIDQLSAGGGILLPLRHMRANPLLSVERSAEDATRMRGRFVGWSGFMAGREALFDESYHPSALPPVRRGAEELALWEGLEPTADRWTVHDRRDGFWFYLGLQDGRASMSWQPRAYGLLEQSTGGSVRAETDRIVVDGDRSLLDELSQYHRRWLELGAPAIADFEVTFAPGGGTPAGSSERTWTITGKHYDRTYSLRIEQ